MGLLIFPGQYVETSQPNDTVQVFKGDSLGIERCTVARRKQRHNCSSPQMKEAAS
jgi:hypothetical protein